MGNELLNALRSYGQADEEGIMCIVSRQAVEEAADEIERLTARVKELEETNSELQSKLTSKLIDEHSDIWNDAREQALREAAEYCQARCHLLDAAAEKTALSNSIISIGARASCFEEAAAAILSLIEKEEA